MSAILPLLSYVVVRLKEPSSWAALATGLTYVHVTVPGALSPLLIQLGIAGAAVLAYFLPEKSA